MSTPDYMKILKSTDEDKIEEFVNVKEYYSNQHDDEEESCLTGNYSRRNVLFVFVAIAILICVIYMLLNKDIN